MGDTARRIAVIAGKGGVGKTTTVINLATAFAEQGYRSLAVDCDPQANLTFGLGFDTYEPRATISEVLCGEARLAEAVVSTSVANLDLLPASTDLVSVEGRLASSLGREILLRKALDDGGIGSRYDYVVFDTPPSFGYHTIIALAAAECVIVPLQMSGFALQGLREVVRVLSVARRSLNPSLQLLGTVPTFVDRRTRFSRDLVEGLHEVGNLRVFETSISRSVRIQETSLIGMSVLRHAPSSHSAEQFRALAREVADAIAMIPVTATAVRDAKTPEVVIVGTPVRSEPATVAAHQAVVREAQLVAALAGPAVALLERPAVTLEPIRNAQPVAALVTSPAMAASPQRTSLRVPIGGRAHHVKRRRWFGLRRAR